MQETRHMNLEDMATLALAFDDQLLAVPLFQPHNEFAFLTGTCKFLSFLPWISIH